MCRSSAVYSLVFVLIVASQSFAQEASKAYPFLKELDVFSGTFEGTTTVPSGTAKSERLGELQGKKVTMLLTTRWAPGKCAQVADASYSFEGGETILGTSLVGWDQKKKQITYREFTTHKGVWNGVVQRDGSKWVFLIEGYNLDGKKVVQKHIVKFTDNDHYTLIATSTTDGEPQPEVTWKFKRI